MSADGALMPPGSSSIMRAIRPTASTALALAFSKVTFPLIGEEPVFRHLAEVGFWIGDTAELAGRPRIVGLSAAARCRLLHLPSRAIQTLLSVRPEHWRAFYRLSAINIAPLKVQSRGASIVFSAVVFLG